MMDTPQHIADELEYQVEQVWKRLRDTPPGGGLGSATLKFEELADVAKRASDALRGVPEPGWTSRLGAPELGWHTGTTGE